MPTIEAHLRRELRKYAIETHKLAYTVPNGAVEYALLQLSERMDITADETPQKYLGRVKAARSLRQRQSTV